MKARRRILVACILTLMGSLGAQTQTSGMSSHPKILFFSIDPLGFITMGPSIQGELLIQGQDVPVGFGFYSGFRLTNLGLATRLLLAGDADMGMSYTIPIGFRIYPRTKVKTDRFFFGPHAEFGRSNFPDGQDEKVRAFGAEVGYKWIFKNGFTLDVSDLIGLIQIKDLPYTETWDTGFWGTGTETFRHEGGDWENLAFVFYMVSAKVGFTL